MPNLHFTPTAARTLECLERGRRADPCRLRRVRRALERLAADPRHPGLRSHLYRAFPGCEGRRVWDSYVDQGAGAWRIFWTYEQTGGRDRARVTVLLIGPHL